VVAWLGDVDRLGNTRHDLDFELTVPQSLQHVRASDAAFCDALAHLQWNHNSHHYYCNELGSDRVLLMATPVAGLLARGTGACDPFCHSLHHDLRLPRLGSII
jgi:hypothetical protein